MVEMYLFLFVYFYAICMDVLPECLSVGPQMLHEVGSMLIRDEAKKQNRREIATSYLKELARQPGGDLKRKLPGHRQNSTIWESSGNLVSLKLPV